jgi:hypothetical protein
MLSETTFEVLRSAGYLNDGDTIARTRFADGCNGVLADREVQTDEQIPELGLIVAELTQQMFGSVEPASDTAAELREIIGQLTGPGGLCQDRLDQNGGELVLCSKVVERTYTNGNGSITIRRPARFVTKSPDLIERYYWLPGRERAIKSFANLNDRLDLGIARVPALAARKQALIESTYDQAEAELPRGLPRPA